MNQYTVIAIDLDEADTLIAYVEALNVVEAERAAMGEFLSTGPGDPEIQYVFEGHLKNLHKEN